MEDALRRHIRDPHNRIFTGDTHRGRHTEGPPAQGPTHRGHTPEDPQRGIHTGKDLGFKALPAGPGTISSTQWSLLSTELGTAWSNTAMAHLTNENKEKEQQGL